MSVSTFRSFKSRNFRLFFMGQSVSLIGTWMQKTAVSWIIYSITGSKFMLGVAVFATLFPTAMVSLFGGVVADRFNRYRVLLTTQFISLLQAVLLTLAVAYFKEEVVWWIIGLSVFLGFINGFDVPARQSLVREMVEDKNDLPNALALNSSMVNLSKLLGPAIAGFVLESFGDVVCFALNALSFVAVIASLLAMRLNKSKTRKETDSKIITEFKLAFSYIKKSPPIFSIIIFVGLMNLLTLPYSTLTPVFAKDIFNGNASTLGVMDGVIGLGALMGALVLASLKEGVDLSRVLAINTFGFGIGLMLFSHTENYTLALFFLAVSAIGMMSVITIGNTIIQLNVPEHLRGRVISIFVLTLTTMLPLGSLLTGAVSHELGVQNTVLVQGIIAVIISLIYGGYLKKQRLRRMKSLALRQQREDTLIRA